MLSDLPDQIRVGALFLIVVLSGIMSCAFLCFLCKLWESKLCRGRSDELSRTCERNDPEQIVKHDNQNANWNLTYFPGNNMRVTHLWIANPKAHEVTYFDECSTEVNTTQLAPATNHTLDTKDKLSRSTAQYFVYP
ncbi:hypothetical protein LSH36_579g05083 [Paralvinella palmiformis]|uniref:Uncharacterized protein n=1 Tax=Paralvinella palmiformis TaxID=53620 RepID=A0AAD9J6B6_9ANNE|nr:hypothetical protein LSH36_579g05083 [Paralvinella palmiformis]